MNKKEFKKALTNTLFEFGFVTKNNTSMIETQELIIVVTTQKSNYENSYYLNYGFLIKALNPELTNPKDNQCDVFGRLNLKIGDSLVLLIDYEMMNSVDFIIALRISLDEKIVPVLKYGIRRYFELFPSAISTTKLNAKKYLGLI